MLTLLFFIAILAVPTPVDFVPAKDDGTPLPDGELPDHKAAFDPAAKEGRSPASRFFLGILLIY
jgi:hypothetical protein